VIESDTYPRARLKRIGAGTSTSTELTPLPRTRVFSWIETSTANSRRTVSGPRCQGPGLLKDISWYLSTHSGGAAVTIEIGYSPVPVTEAGVALGTVRPYTLLTELIDPFAQLTAGAGAGLVDSSIPNTNVRWKEPLDLIIDQSDFFPVVSFVNATVNGQFVHGNLRVVEGILRTALENYF
jgi:hypothetical protein